MLVAATKSKICGQTHGLAFSEAKGGEIDLLPN